MKSLTRERSVEIPLAPAAGNSNSMKISAFEDVGFALPPVSVAEFANNSPTTNQN